MSLTKLLGCLLFCAGCPAMAKADDPRILSVEANRSGDAWRFDVTLRHGDTGWDHYADGWRIEAPDGTELGFRKLLHPHVTEQPFTRSLTGVTIPDGIGRVVVRAHDSVHGWGDPVEIDLGTGTATGG